MAKIDIWKEQQLSKMPFNWENLLSQAIPIVSTGGVKLLLNYLQNKKNPILKFDEFTKTDSPLQPIYFVRVRNTKGEGKAKNCTCRIDIGSSHSQTVWANESDKCDILYDSHEDIRLFKIEFENITSPIQKKLFPKQYVFLHSNQ